MQGSFSEAKRNPISYNFQQQKLMNSQSQRLRKDLCEALTEPLPGFTLYLGSNSDITVWYIEIAIETSSGSLLSGKSVFFELRFPFMYPRLPPILTSLTTIPHSCMTEDSLTVCLDMLNQMSAPMRYGGWSASFTPASILRQLQAFFSPELIDVTDSCLKEIEDFHINVFPTLQLQRLEYKSISHHVNLDDQRKTKPALKDGDEKTVDKATEVVNSVKRRTLRPGGQSNKIKLNDGCKDGVTLPVKIIDLSPLQKPQELEKKSFASDTDLEMLTRVEAKVFSDNIQFSNEFDRHIWQDIIKPTLAPGSIIDNMESSNCTDSTGVTTAYSDLTVTRRSSGSFKGLSTTIIQHILSFCDPKNIAQTMASCKFMYSIITEGFLWKSMVNKHFPGCNIRPPLSTQTGKAWYRIWQLEINGVYYDELNCFYSKKNMNEDVMGIPLDFSINPKTKKIDHIYSTMELLGFGSFKRSNGNTSVWGEEVKGWLPVYLNEEHFRRALPKLAFGLRNLRDSLRAVDSSKDDDNASITSNKSHRQRSQRTDGSSDSIAPSEVWGRNQQHDTAVCVNSRSRSSSISSNSSDNYSINRDIKTEKRNIILTKPSWALGGNGSLQSLVDNSRSSSTTHSTSVSSGRQNPAPKTVHSELAEPLIDVNIVLEVLPRLMSTMVLLLLDDGVDELDQAVRGYGMLHRLFVALVQEFPELKAEVSRRLRTFINDKNARVKSACHNIGEFLPLLSVCDDVSWQDIVVPLIEESFSRGVMWICRDVIELSTATKEHPNIDLLDRIFKASKTSRNIYTFHCCFLHMFQTKSRSSLLSPSNAVVDSTTVPNTSSDVCAVTVKNTEPSSVPPNMDHASETRGACLEGLCNLYDKTLGVTPLHIRRNLARLLKSAKSNTTWERYFDAIGYPCPTEPQLYNMWVDAVQASLNKGYHTKDTDFSKIHRGGISNIILRGKSHSGVVLCIDVSGSMGQTMHHSDSNSYFSRLDFVKMQLEDIFCSKLTNRQKFTVIKFNHYAEKWSSTLMQATESNLHKATQAVNRWHADGGTNMEAALEMSFAVPGVTAVYLLSDGEVDNHEEIMKKVMKWSHNGRINCHTTALYAPPSGQELLRNIAEATNGTYVYYG